MSRYTQIIYQVVFAAKHREAVFENRADRLRMYAYLSTVLRNKKCGVYALNGVEDHLHILFALNPSLALSSLIKDLKLASHDWITKNRLFPGFTNWQRGYSAITYSQSSIPSLIEYIDNQEVHHQKESSLDELKGLLHAQHIDYDERFLE